MWVNKMATPKCVAMGCPGKWKYGLKPFGLSGGLILTHIHMGPFQGGGFSATESAMTLVKPSLRQGNLRAVKGKPGG